MIEHVQESEGNTPPPLNTKELPPHLIRSADGAITRDPFEGHKGLDVLDRGHG